jgi:sugar lactone lactonase YvrE
MKPPKNQLPDASPSTVPPPEEDAGVSPEVGPDAEAPSDTAPTPVTNRPPECDKQISLPIQATFRDYIPDSDDFTFDNDGYFLVRSGRDIARLTYGGPPEMVMKNVVGDHNTIDSLRMLAGGDIVIADYTSDALVRLDVTGKQQRKLASLKSPNKLTVGPHGQLYVVGIEGDIYVVDPDSGMNKLIGRVDGRLRGLAFSVDYQTLYVSDARNNALLSLQMRPDGTADAPRVWARGLGGGPDGLTTDACGNVYVSDHDNSSIRRVTRKGVVELVSNIDRTTSSIGFGSGKQGWDAKTLYTVSVERGGTYEIKVGVPAAPPPPP